MCGGWSGETRAVKVPRGTLTPWSPEDARMPSGTRTGRRDRRACRGTREREMGPPSDQAMRARGWETDPQSGPGLCPAPVLSAAGPGRISRLSSRAQDAVGLIHVPRGTLGPGGHEEARGSSGIRTGLQDRPEETSELADARWRDKAPIWPHQASPRWGADLRSAPALCPAVLPSAVRPGQICGVPSRFEEPVGITHVPRGTLAGTACRRRSSPRSARRAAPTYHRGLG